MGLRFFKLNNQPEKEPNEERFVKLNNQPEKEPDEEGLRFFKLFN